MNKYQEALETAYEMMNTTDFSSAKIGCAALKVLTELVDKEIQTQPTLEEVKKEWEVLNFQWLEDDTSIVIIHKISNLTCFIIDKKSKTFDSKYSFHYDLTPLITKTFKALGWL